MAEKLEFACKRCVHCRFTYGDDGVRRQYCNLTGRNIIEYDQNDICVNRKVKK